MKRIRVVNRTCWGQRLNFKKYRHKILTQVTQNFTIFRKYHPTVSYDQPRGSTTANERRDQFWRTNGRRLFGYGKRGARISPVSGYTDKRGSQEWDGGYIDGECLVWVWCVGWWWWQRPLRTQPLLCRPVTCAFVPLCWTYFLKSDFCFLLEYSRICLLSVNFLRFKNF